MKTAKDTAIPKELLWDYREPPDNLLWRLQRIADFFPAYGTDKENVKLLFEYREKLKLDYGKHRLIELYYEAWNEKTS
ncbi:MAG: hypothetical protein FJ241_06760 [Nitrospira sp.]|nr:hypothetical protein [Nitrospira sp.]